MSSPSLARRFAVTRSPPSTVVGLGLLAGSILMLEVALTRVLAIMMWHHFTYMVVSVGLLGFGAAGSLLTVWGGRGSAATGGVGDSDADHSDPAATDPQLEQRRASALSLCCLGFAGTVVASFAVVTRLEVDHLVIADDWAPVGLLGLLYLLLAVPFLLGGLGVGLALTRGASDVPRLYAFDLLGSALGAAGSVALLAWCGGTATVLFAALGGLGSACCFARRATARLRVGSLVALVIGGVLWLAAAGMLEPLGLPPLHWPIAYAPGKEMSALPPDMAVRRLPSATAEVEITEPFMGLPGMGGDIGYRDRRELPLRFVAQDGTAPTLLFEGAARVDDFPFLKRAQAGSAYVAHAAAGRPVERVAVLGVGGGVDVMMALAHDSASVTAVDLNRAMIRMVRDEYDGYLGGLFGGQNPDLAGRVSLVHAEGRSWLRAVEQRFDVIQLSGVDSFTALSSGAYALAESYLYTVEAVMDLYSHLATDGMVNYSRMLLSHPQKPRETLRLAHIALTALEQLGVADPAAHLAVFRGRHWASTMIKQSPFTEVELDGLRAFASREGFGGLVFDPLHVRGAPFDSSEQLARLQREMLHTAVVELLPDHAPDDAPGDAPIEAAIDGLLPILVASVANDQAAVAEREQAFLAGEPAANVGESARLTSAERQAVARWARGAFAAMGEEFRTEAAALARTRADFEQLLRGDPSERAAFVDGYHYDMSPATDDRPFFFNYYRWSTLGSDPDDPGPGDERVDVYQPDFPVGHRVLLACLVQIVVLALLAIVLPLRRLGRRGVDTPGAGRLFVYFAALGLGFLLIEIPMMQQLVVFLGHPTYALSVVLATMLGSAGLGSLASARLDPARPRTYGWLGVILVLLLLSCALATRFVLPSLLGLALPARIAVTVALLAPLSFVLGMPFPLGLRAVRRRCPELAPWCWAINGFLSVFASIFAVVLSMVMGFTAVFVVAAAVYGLGFFAVTPWVAARRAALSGR